VSFSSREKLLLVYEKEAKRGQKTPRKRIKGADMKKLYIRPKRRKRRGSSYLELESELYNSWTAEKRRFGGEPACP